MKTHTSYFKLALVALLAFVACKPNKSELLEKGIHTVVVKEIIHTSAYTYLRLTEEGNPEFKESDTLWVAAPITETTVGETLYYKGGFPMKDFKSKELNRTFKEVLFLDSLSKFSNFENKEIAIKPSHEYMSSDTTMGKSKIEKIDVKIEPVAGGVTIADLYAKKESYSGKTIKVKGQVTKFSPDIMGKNWIHIQDGTESAGKFDLTITTNLTAVAGEVVTFEGKITLDKDLGYNYFYEVIMEDAKIIK